ncbi:J domain-containing protein [Hymenobacter busanensis]|uniref:J domain-containing protein n=1 Tax=Hymenobacter busanensis TaxID=2607656 RepID=UPI0013669FEA|nr:DnaJ domain-containing protein [Hymenobacter busanensis]QHJ08422.1 DnaJ domain-containing protein [Hymenobacter busanensis]
MSQTLYQVLGVASSATPADIKHAYKQLALRYHPDRNGGSTLHEEQFKIVAAAYRVLGDADRRAAYDHQLRLAALRAEEQRRAQAYRPQAQHVYGVPMPPPAPLCTRRPAASAERHYVRRGKVRFTRRDYQLIAALVVGMLLFAFSLKWVMDRVTAASNYQDGLRAYVHGDWSAAHSFFSETLHFRPQHVRALRRRAEIEQLIFHDYHQARTDYVAALGLTSNRRTAAQLLYRIGQCETSQGKAQVALQTFSRALVLDTTLSSAWLARGEVWLFERRRFPTAVRDFNVGIRQREGQQAPSAKWLTYRGLAFFKMGDYAKALVDYQQVLLLRPTSGQIHFLLGRVAQKQGRTRAACEFFRRGACYGYPPAEQARRTIGCRS